MRKKSLICVPYDKLRLCMSIWLRNLFWQSKPKRSAKWQRQARRSSDIHSGVMTGRRLIRTKSRSLGVTNIIRRSRFWQVSAVADTPRDAVYHSQSVANDGGCSVKLTCDGRTWVDQTCDSLRPLIMETSKFPWNTIRYDTIRDAILTCARKPT